MEIVMIIILFFMTVCFYLLYEGSKYSGKPGGPLALFCKGAATACAFVLALLGFLKTGAAPDGLLAAGLLMCAAADVVLDVHFLSGMGVFALGHVLYCAAYVIKSPPTLLSFLLMALLAGVVYVGRIKLKDRLQARALPFTLYALLLCVMLGLSISQPPVLFLGALLFVISDATLARNMLFGATKRQDYGSLGCYYLGQFLIALSVWVP